MHSENEALLKLAKLGEELGGRVEVRSSIGFEGVELMLKIYDEDPALDVSFARMTSRRMMERDVISFVDQFCLEARIEVSKFREEQGCRS
jgi:hypothetical protein